MIIKNMGIVHFNSLLSIFICISVTSVIARASNNFFFLRFPSHQMQPAKMVRIFLQTNRNSTCSISLNMMTLEIQIIIIFFLCTLYSQISTIAFHITIYLFSSRFFSGLYSLIDVSVFSSFAELLYYICHPHPYSICFKHSLGGALCVIRVWAVAHVNKLQPDYTRQRLYSLKQTKWDTK